MAHDIWHAHSDLDWSPPDPDSYDWSDACIVCDGDGHVEPVDDAGQTAPARICYRCKGTGIEPNRGGV